MKCADVSEELFDAIKNNTVSWICVTCKSHTRMSVMIEPDPDGDEDDDNGFHTPAERRNTTARNILPEFNATVPNSTVEEISSYLKEMVKFIMEIHQSQLFISNQLDQVTKHNKALAKENLFLKKQVVEFENKSSILEERVDQLEADADIQNQRSRQNNIVITGLPESVHDPKEVVLKVLQKVDPTAGIDVFTSLKFHKRKQDGIIVAEFKDEKQKNDFLIKNRRADKIFLEDIGLQAQGSRSREIFVRHHLTEYQAKLYYAAKQIQVREKFRFLWYKNGAIHLRKDEKSKVFFIRSYKDINFIENAIQ